VAAFVRGTDFIELEIILLLNIQLSVGKKYSLLASFEALF
jgi:hypothetical protein